MFGWLTHGSRGAGAPTDQGANGVPASASAAAKPDPLNWNDEVARFTTKRVDSYGLLFHEMSGCRSPLEFAQLQQRWWLNAVQDYAGLAAELYGQLPQTTQASAEAGHGRSAEAVQGREADHQSPPEE